MQMMRLSNTPATFAISPDTRQKMAVNINNPQQLQMLVRLAFLASFINGFRQVVADTSASAHLDPVTGTLTVIASTEKVALAFTAADSVRIYTSRDEWVQAGNSLAAAEPAPASMQTQPAWLLYFLLQHFSRDVQDYLPQDNWELAVNGTTSELLVCTGAVGERICLEFLQLCRGFKIEAQTSGDIGKLSPPLSFKVYTI